MSKTLFQKIADREISIKGELAKAMTGVDFEAVEQLERQLVIERKNLQTELAEKKDEVRQRTRK